MKNYILQMTKKMGNLMLFPLLLLMACEESTPQPAGYYIIDGKKYNVDVMAIYPATFPEPSNNNIEVTLTGAPYYNITMFVSVPLNTLSEGTYHISWGYEPLGINNIGLLSGESSEYITNDIDSEGDMTVEVSEENYVIDFNGQISGHSVEFHYGGLDSNQ